jgi:hypothetical protein
VRRAANKKNATVRTRVDRKDALYRACRRPERMAWPNLSGGRRGPLFFGGRQRISAPMTPTLLNAFTQKGAAMPNATTIRPPSAGPTARLTLIPTLFAAMALGSSGRGTSCGTTACHAGAVAALATVTMKLNTSRLQGVMRCSHTSAANAIDVTATAVSPMIKNRRRSTMSTSAPAGIAKRNIGRLLATCTSDTMSGSASRLVMSHPDATLYIQPPMLETTVATQMTANVR